MRNIVLIIILFTFSNCNSQNIIQGYDLSKPSKLFKLHASLNEISGLEYINNRTLLGVQDERGVIYKISSPTGNIIRIIPFGKKGDYEGITKVKRSYFVLRSDGLLTEVLNGAVVHRYQFKHNKHMDFEGLCYDESKNRLLVACKENLHKGSKKEVFIYSFDLTDKKYKKKPFLKIDKKKVHKNFKPSAIAIHPDGNIYVLSSFSKTLLVLNSKGKTVAKTQLNDIIFHQPEGITFDKKGRLFISNEKHKTYPTLLRFDPK